MVEVGHQPVFAQPAVQRRAIDVRAATSERLPPAAWMACSSRLRSISCQCRPAAVSWSGSCSRHRFVEKQGRGHLRVCAAWRRRPAVAMSSL